MTLGFPRKLEISREVRGVRARMVGHRRLAFPKNPYYYYSLSPPRAPFPSSRASVHYRRSILYSSSSSARNSRAHRIRDLDVGFPVQSSMSRLCAFFPANAAREECASSIVPTAYQAQQDDRVDSRHFQGRVAVESIKINCAPVFLPCLFLAASWRDPVGCSLVP